VALLKAVIVPAEVPLAKVNCDPIMDEVHAVPAPVTVVPDWEAVPVLYWAGLTDRVLLGTLVPIPTLLFAVSMHKELALHSIWAQVCPGLGVPTVIAEASSVFRVWIYWKAPATSPIVSKTEREMKMVFFGIIFVLLYYLYFLTHSGYCQSFLIFNCGI
jgi:hypothetical protein